MKINRSPVVTRPYNYQWERLIWLDPKGLSILAQLLVGLSKLNFRKFKHNFDYTLNPLCPSNDGVEDTEHYFLLCHTYDVQRCYLLNCVNVILLPLLPHGLANPSNKKLVDRPIILYGHKHLSFASNASILTRVYQGHQTL